MKSFSLQKLVALPLLVLTAAVMLASAGGLGSASAAGVGAAVSRFNAIAIPLDVQTTWAAEGIPFTAQGLAEQIGLSSVTQVLRLNPVLQGYDSWFPAGGFGFVGGARVSTAFPLRVGEAYRVVLNNADSSLNQFSLVGSVPAESSITNVLVASGTSCKFNDLMVPLDQSAITNADLLATSLGGSANVEQVLRLNASLQGYDSWFPSGGFGFVGGARTSTPFDVIPGSPYAVCLKSPANGLAWP